MCLVLSVRRAKYFLNLCACLMPMLIGCATTQPSSDSAIASRDLKMSGSSLEINYLRGNNRHRFIAFSSGDAVRAECYRDKLLLKAIKMDPIKYQELMKEASELVDHPNAPLANLAAGPCRTPFTLRLKSVEAVKTLDGCRSTDQGVALGKLIKDAEFLIFSEN